MNKKNNYLFVIEAPGKINKLKGLLEEIFDNNVVIVATHGRLFDLPEDRLSINTSDYSPVDMQPKNKYVIEKIKRSAEGATSIYIMTDSDIEGEVIANDVASIVPSDIPLYRVDLISINEKSIIDAISNPRKINSSMVLSGISRRVYDRLIGYEISSNDWDAPDVPQGSVGRVVTPLLSALSNGEHDTGLIQRIVVSNNEDWIINLSIDIKSEDSYKSAFSLLSSLPDVCIEKISEQVFKDDTRPWTGPEALLEISYALNQPVKLIADEMQKLYENGDISYPRTDNFYLSPETIEQMGVLASHFGVDGFRKEDLAEKAKGFHDKKTQGAHEGIVPLTSRIPYSSNLKDLSLPDQILVILARNIMRSGQGDREIHLDKGIISNSEHSKKWNELLSGWPSGYSITRKYTSRAGYTRKQIINEKIKPLGHMVFDYVINKAYIRRFKKDWIVANVMVCNNLGRPSTIAYHADKISRKMLNENGYINGYAQSSINRAAILSPGLLDINNSIEIEELLHSKGNKGIKERIIEALIMSKVVTGITDNKKESSVIASEDIVTGKTDKNKGSLDKKDILGNNINI